MSDDTVRNIFEGKEQPPQELLAGGVDLNSPERQILRSFQDTLDQEGGAAALVVFAQTKSGRVIVNHMTPGGMVQLLGLIEMAKQVIIQAQVAAQRGGQPTPPSTG